MPYPGDEVEGNQNVRDYLNRQLGITPPFKEEELDAAGACKVTHSSFDDPGPDWNRFALYTKDGVFIAAREQEAY